MQYYSPGRIQQLRPGRRSPLGSLFFLLVLIAGLSFFIYKYQTGTTISTKSHPTLVIPTCTGSAHIQAAKAVDQITIAGWPFPPYQLDQASNTVTVSDCNRTIIVPAQTDLKIDADTIDVIGVSGQMQLSTNGGTITLTQVTLLGQSNLQSNGGPLRFSGSIAPQASCTFDVNGGSIDLALPTDAIFHIDITGIISSITSDFPGLSPQNNEVHADIGLSPSAKLKIDVNDSPIILKKI
ncbi:MAG TPA: hypothetical protein VFU49_16530 [Ktedonobacteraceae bacterium]|nr:hypothetical protein [Ktedonobacteraceae bacterium]